jgi:predicted RNA-binding Zn-ribbon protein involved in translation (DUF1610 family)
MGKVMQTISCAECMESMAPVKHEFLTRIACANCQQAKEDLAAHDRRQQRERPWGAGGEALRRQEIPGCSDTNAVLQMLGRFRCPQCGKWCWTRNALARHGELHRTSRN